MRTDQSPNRPCLLFCRLGPEEKKGGLSHFSERKEETGLKEEVTREIPSVVPGIVTGQPSNITCITGPISAARGHKPLPLDCGGLLGVCSGKQLLVYRKRVFPCGGLFSIWSDLICCDLTWKFDAYPERVFQIHTPVYDPPSPHHNPPPSLEDKRKYRL